MKKKKTGYGQKYHTGMLCIESGCNRPAGTWWSRFWCQKHDYERRKKITETLEKLKAAGWVWPD